MLVILFHSFFENNHFELESHSVNIMLVIRHKIKVLFEIMVEIQSMKDFIMEYNW